MRIVIVFLAACALGFAASVSTSVQCGAVVIEGRYSASCETVDALASAEVSVAGLSTSASAFSGVPPSSASAGASFYADDYILTVTGGSGSGFAEPQLTASGEYESFWAEATAQVSIHNSSGGCIAGTGPTGRGFLTDCNPYSIPFVFGTRQIFIINILANANSISPLFCCADPTSYASLDGFEFFDTRGQPLSGISWTFAPVPEPATLPLATVVCGAFVSIGLYRNKITSGRRTKV